jgi:hypothetical protein
MWMETNMLHRTLVRTWFAHAGVKNVVSPLARYEADALALHSHWRFIVYTPVLPLQAELSNDGVGIFQEWLRDFTCRRMALDNEPLNYVLRVLEDMACWVKRNGGNPKTVRAAAAIIDDVGDDNEQRADRLVALLYRFIAAGRLGIQQEGFADPRVKLSLYRINVDGVAGIFIPCATVDALLAKSTLLSVDSLQITKMLADATGLNCEYEYNGQAGWLVVESWWHSHLDLCRRRQQALLAAK